MKKGRLTFKSKQAEKVWEIFSSLPPLSDEDAKRMVQAIQKVTGRRHPLRSPKRPLDAPSQENPS